MLNTINHVALILEFSAKPNSSQHSLTQTIHFLQFHQEIPIIIIIIIHTFIILLYYNTHYLSEPNVCHNVKKYFGSLIF